MATREKRATNIWSVAEAKAKFSEVIERAEGEGPQRITRNGRDVVVVVAALEWAKSEVDETVQRNRDLSAMLQRAQLQEGELVIPPRRAEPLREIDW